MAHSPVRSGAPIVKRPWTPEEDELLIAAVGKYGAARWSMIATTLETGRAGKQCRERWNNHLCPDVKKSEWSADEDYAIMQGVAVFGSRWCEIVKTVELAGRTDNAIKNRYFSLQRKVKATNGPIIARKGTEEPLGESKPLSERDARIVEICRELAFTTFEPDRDELIEQLTFISNGGTEDDEIVSDDDEDRLEIPMPPEADHELSKLLSVDEIDALLGCIQPEPLRKTSPRKKKGEETTANKAKTTTTTTTTFKPLSALVKPLPAEVEEEELEVPALVDGSSFSGSGRASIATSPVPDALPSAARIPMPPAIAKIQGEADLGKKLEDNVTAAVLGGRFAHQAMLAPLSLPTDAGSALHDSPKRMRTPSGPLAVPSGVVVPRRPSALRTARSFGSDKVPAANVSPCGALSPLSTASTELDERNGATGTEEPARASPPTASKLKKKTASSEDADGGGGGVMMPASLEKQLSFDLSDFEDLFGEDLAGLPSPCAMPKSSGKRKNAMAAVF